MTDELDEILLSDPDFSDVELGAVEAVLRSASVSSGEQAERFEQAFAAWTGRRYGIAVASGAIGLLVALKGHGIGPGDEVIVPAHGYRESADAVLIAGATPVFADIDYWAGTLSPEKAEAKISPATRAIVAANTNGHPAPWPEFRALADAHGLVLIEDSCEAIGSRHVAGMVGSFGDVAIFDFAQPSLLCCGEGGMLVTDDVDLAMAMRRLVARKPGERASVSAATTAPLNVPLSDLAAALALAQLSRIDLLIERRQIAQNLYYRTMRSFEGIKDPYVAPGVESVNWMLYVVHLGTRFTRSARDQILADMATEAIAAAPYSVPLHLQRRYRERGWKKGDLFVTEKVADRAIALPLHAHLAEEQIAFIVARLKDASINVGAGAAIY